MRTLSTVRLVVLPVLLMAQLIHVSPTSATVADELCSAASDPCVVNATVTLTGGSVIDVGSRALHFGSAARVTLGAGLTKFVAGSVRLLPGARITGSSGSGVVSMDVVSAGSIALEANGGTLSRIDLSSNLISGLIALRAQTGITLAGNLFAEGRATEADGGVIQLLTAAGDVVVSGLSSVRGGGLAGGGLIDIDAGGVVSLTNFVDISGGDFGGGELDVKAGGDVAVGQDILANGGGLAGDGGSVSIDSKGSVRLLHTIKAGAVGDADEGGGTGGDVDIVADGDVVLSAPLQLRGAAPDGEGGSVFIVSGGSVQQTAMIDIGSTGIDSCGGSMFVTAGRDVALDRIELGAGSCGGGDLSVQGIGMVRANGGITADGTTRFSSGGSIELQGRDVVTVDALRGNAGDEAGNGAIFLKGCNVTVDPLSELRAVGGAGGGTTIVASGRATVRGTLVTANGGTNRVEFRDSALPPLLTGAINPAAEVASNPALPPCPDVTAACGDGAVDSGEVCDDGNNASCDGCSGSCQPESCGNGRVECDEQCDAGLSNGTPASGCDAQCRLIPLPGGLLLFPGGGTRNSCMAEWRIKNPGGLVDDGFPSRTQLCTDGDPTCDQDGATDGKCVYQTAVCTLVTDPRLPGCAPGQIASVALNQPKPLGATDPVDAANGAALRDAIAGLGLTVKSGSTVVASGAPSSVRDQCSSTMGVTVPHDPGRFGTKVINMGARDGLGGRMRENRITLVCLPNTAVCGDGTVEVGEQCDDGNQATCDGCGASCRAETCGDGTVECDEQCDDGPANGTSGSTCTTACAEVVPALRIPGGGSRSTDCLLESALTLERPALKRDGTPSNKQRCVDNDPGCDFDPATGACQLHLWFCLGGADDRLQCLADSVTGAGVSKPADTDAAQSPLRQAIVAQLGAVPLPRPPGERCTGRIDVEVPAGRRGATVGLRVRGLGGNDSDVLKLRCEPARR
jgi:cysteine-rich repeat protein